MLDTSSLKKLFPIFANRPGLVYLDSAATSLKPAPVIDAERRYYEEYSANIERGLYPISEQATKEYEKSREKVARFIGADHDEIIFTRGTTDGINLIATALTGHVRPGDEIVITAMEHHSNFLPWQALALRAEATLKISPLKDDFRSDFPLQGLITPKTKILALPFVSNVLGTILPVQKLIREARRVNPDIIVVVDAAQAAAHLPIDVRALDCDFLAFSGHKIFGPTGIGVLYGKRKRLTHLPPAQYGGEMVERASMNGSTWKPAPHKFEAGTPPIADAIALGTAIDFIQGLGLENIRAHEKKLLGYAIDGLKKTFGKDLVIFGPKDIENRSGVVAFTIAGVHPHDLAHVLGESDICIRAGRHCAEPLHDALGVSATARMSVSAYSSKGDVDALIAGIRRASRLFTKE